MKLLEVVCRRLCGCVVDVEVGVGQIDSPALSRLISRPKVLAFKLQRSSFSSCPIFPILPVIHVYFQVFSKRLEAALACRYGQQEARKLHRSMTLSSSGTFPYIFR